MYVYIFGGGVIFLIITKIIPPEHSLCDVGATSLFLFAREHVKEFALESDCFVIFTKFIVQNQFACRVFVCSNCGRNGNTLQKLVRDNFLSYYILFMMGDMAGHFWNRKLRAPNMSGKFRSIFRKMFVVPIPFCR